MFKALATLLGVATMVLVAGAITGGALFLLADAVGWRNETAAFVAGGAGMFITMVGVGALAAKDH